MYIKDDFDFDDLEKACWSGALDTLKIIKENGKEEEFMEYLEESFGDIEEVPTMTAVNDFLWFDDDAIFDALNIKQEEE